VINLNTDKKSSNIDIDVLLYVDNGYIRLESKVKRVACVK